MTIPDQTQGIQLLADLYEHLDSGKPITKESASTIVAAIRHSLCSGDTIDTSLGLHCAGRSNSLSSRIAKVRRNGFLVSAVVSVREGDMSDWKCCKLLANRIKAFDTGNEWRSTRYKNSPPSTWPDWKRYLWFAKSTDIDLPTSAEQLRTIMLQNAAFNPDKETEKLLASKLYPMMHDAIHNTDRQH